MSVGKKAADGFIQLILRNALGRVMGLLAMVFLARELNPYDFGLVSITQVLLGAISVFGTTGITEFLLAYRNQDAEEIYKSAFWFTFLIAVAVGMVVLIALPFWADSYHDDRILSLGAIIVGIFLINQLSSIAKSWLSKKLQFKKQVKIQAPFIIIVALTKIGAVFLGLGVYSLVLPTLIFAPIEAILLFIVSGLKPGFKLYYQRWIEIFRFSKHLIGSAILGLFTDHGDKFILSKWLGLEALGVYNLAYQLANLISLNVVSITNNILSAALPQYAHDKNLLYQKYMDFLSMMAFFLFPVLLLLAVNASAVIYLVYGPQWNSAALPLVILIIYALFRTITSSYGSIMNTLHLPNEALKLNVWYTPAHLIGSVGGASIGVPALAAMVVAVKLIFSQMGVRQVMKALDKPWTDYYKKLLPQFITGILATLVCIPVLPILQHFITNNQWSYVLQIVITSVLFIGISLAIYRLKYTNELTTIYHSLKSINPRLGKWYQSIFNLQLT